MPQIKIPDTLKSDYERIVDVLYEGDEDKALREAVELFVAHELKRLPSDQKFGHLMEKRLAVEADKEGYSNKEISSAFEKLQERKKRLESFTLGKKKE